MNNTAILIHADGIEEPMVPANGTDFDLDELQKAVGGLIEIINLRGDERILVINEEGKFMSLDENVKATALAHEFKAIFPNDIIVGDVVVCHTDMVK